MGFCKEFNAATQASAGDLLPTIITVYKDSSFTFVTKQPPAAVLLKKAAGLASGSGEPNKVKVGTLSRAKLMEVVDRKIVDLNTNDPEQAAKILAGTARQMGLEIEA
jgi:large subunit ribosomal protein L11